jgi:hypothetical protein
MIDHSSEPHVHETAGALHSAGDARPATEREIPRRATTDALTNVRASDLEPYTGLRYLSKLFRMIAVILLLVLIAEVATGIITHGTAAIPTLLGEASRLVVLAGLLWGSGDLAILLVDIGHDLRATRILIGRQVVHQLAEPRRARTTDRDPSQDGESRARAQTSGSFPMVAE